MHNGEGGDDPAEANLSNKWRESKYEIYYFLVYSVGHRIPVKVDSILEGGRGKIESSHPAISIKKEKKSQTQDLINQKE